MAKTWLILRSDGNYYSNGEYYYWDDKPNFNTTKPRYDSKEAAERGISRIRPSRYEGFGTLSAIEVEYESFEDRAEKIRLQRKEEILKMLNEFGCPMQLARHLYNELDSRGWEITWKR